MVHNATTKENFLQRVKKMDNGCWIWTGYVDEIGYGIIGAQGKNWKTHRLSWFYFNGNIPNGKKVLHKCDVRNCVNPDHLFLGTQSDNMKDCKNKGRNVSPKLKGTENPMSVLTDKQVLEMRKFRKETNLSYSKIGKKFKVSAMTAYRAIVGESWNHI